VNIIDDGSYHQELHTYFPLKLADSSLIVVNLIHFSATETKASCLKHKKNQHAQGFPSKHNTERAWLNNLVHERVKEKNRSNVGELPFQLVFSQDAFQTSADINPTNFEAYPFS
jgi:hypothetical protein